MNIEDFSYEYDSSETFSDYLRELKEYKEEKAVEETKKNENLTKDLPETNQKRRKNRLGRGLGALLSSRKKD